MPSETPSKAPIPPQVVDAALQQWGDSRRQSTFTVSGKSMEPFLVAGDKLLIRHGRDNIRTGGLIAFRQEDSLVVHRLLRIVNLRGEKMMLLRGDNNDYSDPLIPVDRLVGRATAVTRRGKTYQLDTPLSCWASLLIALFARFSMTSEQWVRKIRRRWFPDRHVVGAAKKHRLLIRAFFLPGRFLTFLLWRILRYTQPRS